MGVMQLSDVITVGVIPPVLVRFKPVCYQTCQSYGERAVAMATLMFGLRRLQFDWFTRQRNS